MGDTQLLGTGRLQQYRSKASCWHLCLPSPTTLSSWLLIVSMCLLSWPLSPWMEASPPRMSASCSSTWRTDRLEEVEGGQGWRSRREDIDLLAAPWSRASLEGLLPADLKQERAG